MSVCACVCVCSLYPPDRMAGQFSHVMQIQTLSISLSPSLTPRPSPPSPLLSLYRRPRTQKRWPVCRKGVPSSRATRYVKCDVTPSKHVTMFLSSTLSPSLSPSSSPTLFPSPSPSPSLPLRIRQLQEACPCRSAEQLTQPIACLVLVRGRPSSHPPLLVGVLPPLPARFWRAIFSRACLAYHLFPGVAAQSASGDALEYGLKIGEGSGLRP